METILSADSYLLQKDLVLQSVVRNVLEKLII